MTYPPMNETTSETDLSEVVVPPQATDSDILSYLRHSYRMAEVAAAAELEAVILNWCKQFNISVSDQELQTAGDAFRLEQKLLSSTETFAWLERQRISVEDWSQGIRIKLLTQKLKEHLFGDVVDTHYISDRDQYKRVALSQILVSQLPQALQVLQSAQANPAAFCALALEYSGGKQSKPNGGFIGIHFLAQLMPEVAQAIANAEAGEMIGPIHTKLGYHIIKVEKWFAAELTEFVRSVILDSLFEAWLKDRGN